MSLNRERLEKRFTEEYQKLNEQQRQAVDTIEGPVMVIAGPGTGKTQILASRIGKILLVTDVFPEIFKDDALTGRPGRPADAVWPMMTAVALYQPLAPPVRGRASQRTVA